MLRPAFTLSSGRSATLSCKWLCTPRRVDPAVRLPTRLDTEPARAHFLRAALQAAQARAGLRLDARRLYGADAAAVPDLARLAALLQPPAGSAAVRATQLANSVARVLSVSTPLGPHSLRPVSAEQTCLAVTLCMSPSLCLAWS